MDKRFLTLFVLTNDASKSRQLKVPFKLLKAAGAVTALFTLVFAFVLYDYARIKVSGLDSYSLKKENTDQRLALQTFASKIKELESQVARLNLFDRKLRIIADLEDAKPAGKPSQVLGMGGDGAVEEEIFSTPGAKVEELVGKMRSDLTELEDRTKTQEASFAELHDYLAKKSVMLASTPSIWPARGWVTSTFGGRISPFTGSPQHHSGMDIANRVGTQVVASADGLVVDAGRDTSLGKKIVISHGYGMKTTYGHLSETYVRVGQKIKRGAKIGAMGNTGRSTGPHLHYAVSVNGINVNPEKYIVD